VPTAHEMDYKIHGHEMQYVEIELDPGESAVAEAGSLMYKDVVVEMTTVFGDGSNQQSGGFVDRRLRRGDGRRSEVDDLRRRRRVLRAAAQTRTLVAAELAFLAACGPHHGELGPHGATHRRRLGARAARRHATWQLTALRRSFNMKERRD
jgi:hypothetical protein